MKENKKLPKSVWLPLTIVGSLLIVGLIVFVLVYTIALKVDLKISANQVEQTQSIVVNWDTSKPVDEVVITVKHGNDLVRKSTLTQYDEIVKGQMTIPVYYGKLTVKVDIKKGIYKTSKKVEVKVFTNEYNIAPITATMPVTLFTLSLEDITNKGQIPTFVWFKRSGAWDWSKLPENVYPMPVASTSELLNSGENTMYKKTSAYVKELYSMNKNSKFNFYYNDYFAFGALQATIANGISPDNYHITFLSDGTASFNYFNKHLNNANYETEYANMVKKYETLKEQIAKRKTYKKTSVGFSISADNLREYAFVMANEESNVDWWLTRASGTLGTFVLDTETGKTVYDNLVAPTIGTAIQVKDLKTLLVKIDPKVDNKNAGKTDEEINEMTKDLWFKKEDLKALYKFSDTMFDKAKEENKEVMVILGTWTQTEQAELFDNYVKAIQAYYGENYVYYYKGHPRNPTDTVAGKRKHLEELGLIDIDSTIPAELIFFFNPDAFGSGYQSSTFLSVSAEKTCAIIKTRKDTFSESYKPNVDIFMSLNTLNSAKTGFTSSQNCVLLEFNDTTKYNIAIFDVTQNKLTYYKLNESSVYEEVQA